MKSITFYKPDGVSKKTEIILESTESKKIDRIFFTEEQIYDLYQAIYWDREIRLEQK